MDQHAAIKVLSEKIERLLAQQEFHKSQILHLRNQLDQLSRQWDGKAPEKSITEKSQPVEKELLKEKVTATPPVVAQKPFHKIPAETKPTVLPKTKPSGADLEQFIGGNLVNKVGMIILLVGIGLFVKYAVDKGWIPPPVRVALGYLAGLILNAFAYRFRSMYPKYSAVLFSGGMAVMYFTSYLGHVFFNPPVIAMLAAFLLMVVLTAVTVGVASYFRSEIIGVLGLVGAYAVPFLVNDGTENFLVFFSYISIINLVILILAIRNKWQMTTRTAFFVSWIIFFFTYVTSTEINNHFALTFTFISLNSLLFLAAFVYEFLQSKEGKNASTLLLIGFNMAFYYLYSILLMVEQPQGSEEIGEWTFLLGVITFLAASILHKKYKFPKLFWFLSLIAALFLILAVPIEFEIKPVITLWTAICVGLFYVARRFKRIEFEVVGYVLGAITGLSLVSGWISSYFDAKDWFTPIANTEMLVSLSFLTGAYLLYRLDRELPPKKGEFQLGSFLQYLLAAGLFLLFLSEVFHALKPIYWENTVGQPLGSELDIMAFQRIAVISFSLLFFAGFGWFYRNKIQKESLGNVLLFGGIFLGVCFMIGAIMDMNYLRNQFIDQWSDKTAFISVRYIGYLVFIPFAMVFFYYLNNAQVAATIRKYSSLLLHFLLLFFLSHEVITLLSLYLGSIHAENPYREGLSILWGLYSFLLVGIGMKKDEKILRLAGIGLFGITIAKVFLFDLTGLSLISRMGLFIGLGTLLLVTSYLYQRKNKVEDKVNE